MSKDYNKVSRLDSHDEVAFRLITAATKLVRSAANTRGALIIRVVDNEMDCMAIGDGYIIKRIVDDGFAAMQEAVKGMEDMPKPDALENTTPEVDKQLNDLIARLTK